MKKTHCIVITCVFFLAAFVSAEENIIEAAKVGNAARVESLLRESPGLVNATDGGLRATALHWACIYGKKDVVRVILKYNPDVNTEEAHAGTTMHWAAHYDDSEVVGWLLDHGAKIDHVNNYGRTPLLVATRRNCVNVIDILVERGANIDARLRDGSTALHIAAINGHTAAIERLLLKGADKNAKNDRGETYADILFVRPKTITIDTKLYDSYAGLYERENGALLDIRKENDALFYYAYGKDELLPLSETHFIRHAELGYFTFVRDETGKVDAVIFKIGSTESRAKKIK